MYSIISITCSDDFLSSNLNMFDCTEAYKDFGDGDKQIWFYRLSHIKKQFTNDGQGVWCNLLISQTINEPMPKEALMDIVLSTFGEYFI